MDAAAGVAAPARARHVGAALVAALRGRGFAATIAIAAAAACVGAVGLDALLFAAGVARLGEGAAVLVALAAPALQIAGMAAQALTPAELGDHLDGALTTTASGLHKVSGM